MGAERWRRLAEISGGGIRVMGIYASYKKVNNFLETLSGSKPLTFTENGPIETERALTYPKWQNKKKKCAQIALYNEPQSMELRTQRKEPMVKKKAVCSGQQGGTSIHLPAEDRKLGGREKSPVFMAISLPLWRLDSSSYLGYGLSPLPRNFLFIKNICNCINWWTEL